MVKRIPLEVEKYSRLEYRQDESKEIPYIQGTNFRVDNIYVFAHMALGMSPEDIAKEKGLSLEVIMQSFRWCKENENLLSRVLEEEAKEGGVED